MINIFEPEVSVVTKGLKGKSVLLYGANRTGKTLNCSKANKPVFLRFENGLGAINGVKNFPMTKWSDWTKFVKDMTDEKNLPKAQEMYETIIVDTIDRMLALGEEWVCAVQGVPSLDRDASGKKGWGVWKEYRAEMSKWVNKLTNSGYAVIFIGHEDTRKLRTDTGEEYEKIYPRGDKRSVDVMADICDFICYATAQNNNADGEEVRSTLHLKGTPAFLAGSRFEHIIPTIHEWSMDKLEAAIGDAVAAQEKADGVKAIDYDEAEAQAKKAEAKAEKKKVPMDTLIGQIGEKLEKMNTTEGSIESYLKILEEELGNRDFKAMNATEAQREQVELILDTLVSKGY